MDTVAYPSSEVVSFVSDNLVPVRVRYDAEPLSSDFHVPWTPTIVLLDPEGHEHNRTVGYLAPQELLPTLMLGIARWHYDVRRFGLAEKAFQQVIDSYPDSDAAPEATYLRGVCRYKQSGDFADLSDARRELVSRYPESVWARRAEPYERAA